MNNTLDFGQLCKVPGVFQSVHQNYFEAETVIHDYLEGCDTVASVFDADLTELSTGFDILCPAGFTKTEIAEHNSDRPFLEKVPVATKTTSRKQIAQLESIFRLNSPCSEVPKKRYDYACCPQQKMAIENEYTCNNGCPANVGPKAILSSAQNLFARDSSGSYHTYHLIMSTIPSYKSDILEESAQIISQKEKSTKITASTVANAIAKNIEVGLYFPESSTYQSIKLKNSERLLKNAGNTYLRKSQKFQDELMEIALYRHRVARALPNISQVTAISQYAYLMSKNEAAWSQQELVFQSPVPMKIYDPNFRWRHSYVSSQAGVSILPPMSTILGKIARELDSHEEFFGDSPEKIGNRRLLEDIRAKIIWDCKKERKIPLDSDIMAETFRQQEFEFTNETRERAQVFDLLNTQGSQETINRAPPSVNSLVDIELSLHPSKDTLAKFYEKRGADDSRTR